MKKKIIFGLVVLGLIASSAAYAAEFVGPANNEDQNIVVGAAETHKNLYVAGPNVTVNGNTQGDLYAAGGMVSVEGTVKKDLALAGGNLFLNGAVGEDARIAGGNITISAPIFGDLLIGGGNVTLSEKASVGGDLIIGGGNVNINAPIKGSVKIAGGSVYINSKIGGEVKVQVSKNLTFGPKSEILNKVAYQAPKTAVFQAGSQVPNAEFTLRQHPSGTKAFSALITAAFLVKVLAWIIAGLILVRLRKQLSHKIFVSMREKPWENLGLGLLGLVVVPIVVILLLISFVGYYLAFIAGAAYAIILLLANIYAAVMIGYLILKYLSKPVDMPVDWQAVVIGVVVLTLLKLIPIVGWLVFLVVFLMVLGAMARIIKHSLTE